LVAVSDYYQFDDLLTDEEKAFRKKVRGIMEKEIAPIMTEYWEKAEFPFHAIPKLATLGLAGGTTKVGTYQTSSICAPPSNVSSHPYAHHVTEI